MRTSVKLSITLIAVAGMMAVQAGAASEEPGWLAPSIGPISPSLHFNGAIGDSSGDPEGLAVGHHDPTREDGTVQGIEAGLSLRLGMLQGFATHSFHYGADEEWESEWEEAFLKLKDLPGGLEVRGGRMLARFGRHNTRHLHSWDFVDMPLVWGRFLGDDGLITDGGDVTWLKQGVGRTYGVTVAYGDAKTHEHGHDEHEEEEEEHHDHEEHAEAMSFVDDVISGRVFGRYEQDESRSFEAGLSAALGEAEAGEDIAVYGADFAYTWQEAGVAATDRSLTWLTEILYRDIGEGDEHHDQDHEEEHSEDSALGLYSQLVFTPGRALDVALRVGYVDDIERLRVSPAVTYYPDPYRRTSVRLQVNHDELDGPHEEQTVWLQVGASWGGAEVR